MSRFVFPLLFIALFSCPLFAQVAIGQWREHLPYDDGVQVADAGDWVYAASKNGLFKHSKIDGDVVRLSKVTGLSDIGFSAIAWSDDNNTLVIGYTNTNIDLLQDDRIINIPDIKNKSILGNKTINKIHISGDYAYLACGFAIVVVDMVKHEIKDTYYIGAGGNTLNIFDVATSETRIYACTESGVLSASLTSINLANFENWFTHQDIPSGTYNTCTWFHDKLYANLAVPDGIDTIYVLNSSGVWNPFGAVAESNVKYLESTEERLLISASGSVAAYNSSHERVRLIFEYGWSYAYPNHATMDNEGTVWIADRESGLVRNNDGDYYSSQVKVNGPSSISNTDISIWDGRVYVASGSITSIWSNGYNNRGLYRFVDNQWENIKPTNFQETFWLRDYLSVIVDPFDSKRVYATCYGNGLVEYYDDEYVAFYDTLNSTLQDLPDYPGNIRVVGVQVDRNTGTLWVTGSGTNKLIYAKDRQGTWYGYRIPTIGQITLSDIAIDDIGQKWMVAPRGIGVVVYNDNGTLAYDGDDQSIKLTQNPGNGDLASNEVYCITADLDGEIWVGTSNGISVFYSPESVFTGGNFDSQQILVEQDGYVQYLLENEDVSAIAVDGANRKWVGTVNAGVFLLSDDGTEEVLHFTQNNSPLFSDRITALGVDHLSGEVFIGTDKGILSYRSDATWGAPEFVSEDVYAFPNPVEPDYEGSIAVKGLVRDADVKITDAAGNVVFATTANGGEAVWNGNKASGERAKSGVYLVFASNEDGKETFVTKILFIN